MVDYTVDVDTTRFCGQRSFYIVASSGTVYLDAWQATDSQVSRIQTINSGKPVKTQSYDLSGRKLSDSHQHRGIVIEQYTDEKGVKHSRKRF